MPPVVTEPRAESEPTPALAAERPLADVPEFAEIYEQNSQAIYYLALRFLGNASRAEDATHDVFLKAFRKLGQFKGGSNIRTWLYRITINHCQNLQQSWHHRHIHAVGDAIAWDNAAPAGDNPFRVLENKELGERIQKALDGLPEEYRLLLLLIADDELSYEEIGNLTGQSADAVRGKLHRARKAFAAAFRK